MDKKTLNLANQWNEDIAFLEKKISELEETEKYLQEKNKDGPISVHMYIGKMTIFIKIDVNVLKKLVRDQKKEFECDLVSLIVQFDQL